MHEHWHIQHPFALPLFQDAIGLDIFERLDAYATIQLNFELTGVFSRQKPFWHFCKHIFQEWLLGEDLYTRTRRRG